MPNLDTTTIHVHEYQGVKRKVDNILCELCCSFIVKNTRA